MSDDDDALYLAVLEAEEKGTIPFLNSNKHGEAFATSSTGMHRFRLLYLIEFKLGHSFNDCVILGSRILA